MPSPNNMRAIWKYELLFVGDAAWTDVSAYVDSRETSIERNGCSNELKSSIDVCSIMLKYNTTSGKTAHATLVGRLLAAKLAHDIVKFKCTVRTGGAYIFTGKLDLGNLSQTNKANPGWLELEAEDNSYLLEAEMTTAFEYPAVIGNTPYYVFKPTDTTHSIVHLLALQAGYLLADIDNTYSDVILTQIQHISYNPLDKRTFRDFLDTLLFDCCATYTFTEAGKLQVRSLVVEEGTTADYNLGSAFFAKTGVVTKSGDRQEDGVEIKWSTLAAMRAKVYSANISLSRDEDGEIIGEELPPETYYPETGDIEDVYQDFSSNWLDRPYFTKSSRLQNKDLSLITVQSPELEVVHDADIVIVPTPVYESKRAKVLLFNESTTETRNLKAFDIYGNCLYRSKVNKYTVPSTSVKPKEYESEFVFNENDAARLADHLRLFYSYGDVQHSWRQIGKVPMFSIVTVSPPNSAISTIAMVIRVKETVPGDGSVFSDVQAVGVSIFNSESPKKEATAPGSSPVVGPPGPPSRLLYLTSDGVSIPTTSRGVVRGEDITLFAQLQNINSTDVTWTVSPSGSITLLPTDPANPLSRIADVSTLALGVTSVIIEASLTFLGVTYVDQVTLNAVADGLPAPLNLGVLDAAPTQTPLGEAIVAGDYFLYYKATADAPYVNGTSYRYNGTAWVAVTSTTTDYSTIMANTLADAMKLPTTVPVTSAYNGYFYNLAAYSAFIKYARVTNLIVGEGDETTGFRFRAVTDDIGDGTGLPAIDVYYDGVQTFSINPSTGQVQAISALLINAFITGTGTFEGDILNPLFKVKKGVTGDSVTMPAAERYRGWDVYDELTFIPAVASNVKSYATATSVTGTVGGKAVDKMQRLFSMSYPTVASMHDVYIWFSDETEIQISGNGCYSYAIELTAPSAYDNASLITLRSIETLVTMACAFPYGVRVLASGTMYNNGTEELVTGFVPYSDHEALIEFYSGDAVNINWVSSYDDEGSVNGWKNLSGTITVITEDDLVETSTITPVASSDSLGSEAKPFLDGWFSGTVHIGTINTGTSGSCALPNGFILKWGLVNLGQDDTETVTFATLNDASFPNDCINVTLQGTADSAAYTNGLYVYSWSASNFVVKTRSTAQIAMWLAIGY